MASITLTNLTPYAGGKSGASSVVGYESSKNRVARYTMLTDSVGASSVSLSFSLNTIGDGTAPSLRFYIGTDPSSHINAGASSSYTGTLTRSGDTYVTYSGSANIVLLPSTTYYVYVFPANTTYGWMYWSKESGAAVATTSGGAASTFTCGNGTLNTAQTISVTRYSTSFTHTLTYKCGSASGTIGSAKTSTTSISWTPPLTLANQNTTGTSVSVEVTLQTYSGSTPIGNPVSKTVTMAFPASVKPSCTLAVSDLMGYATTYGAYVKGLSRLSVTVTPTTSYGSAIKSYSTTANGITYHDASFTTAALKSSGSQTISATVTDKRDRTSSAATKTINVLDYTAPAVTKLSVTRCNSNGAANSQGAYVKVVFSASVTPLNNKNGAEYILHYKKSTETEYTGVALDELYGDYTVADYSYVFAADTMSSYDVQITIEDNHFGIVGKGNAPTAFTLLHFRADGTGIGVGKVAERANSFECGLTMYDKFGALMGNGLAAYSGGGDTGIDPNTTLEELCLTSHTNAPQGLGTFYYIHTAFYNTKSATATRAQVAIPYNKAGSMYHRYYASGAWSGWSRYMTVDEIYPVNSIYISYSHTSPASIFGGTWHRMQSRFLWGTTTTGTIGATGGEQTHTLTASEMPSHNHTNVVYASGGSNNGKVNHMAAYCGKVDDVGWTNITLNTGGGAAHNNMPPYVNVAIWRRTA